MVLTDDDQGGRGGLLSDQSPKLGSDLDSVCQLLLRDPKAGNQFAVGGVFLPIERGCGLLNPAAVRVRIAFLGGVPAESPLAGVKLDQCRLGRSRLLSLLFLRACVVTFRFGFFIALLSG